jgi:hypothetical protein
MLQNPRASNCLYSIQEGGKRDVIDMFFSEKTRLCVWVKRWWREAMVGSRSDRLTEALTEPDSATRGLRCARRFRLFASGARANRPTFQVQVNWLVLHLIK